MYLFYLFKRLGPETGLYLKKNVLNTKIISDTPITAFDDSSYTVEAHHAGLVSMYENDLCVVFRTYRSGVFFFSMADQGDVLIAQIIHGTVHVIFDFGSLTPSRISAGKALDDGRWHEVILNFLDH